MALVFKQDQRLFLSKAADETRSSLTLGIPHTAVPSYVLLDSVMGADAMTTPLRSLPGLRPLGFRRRTAETRIGFIWRPHGAMTTEVEELPRFVSVLRLTTT
jgi:hypothetical protein